MPSPAYMASHNGAHGKRCCWLLLHLGKDIKIIYIHTEIVNTTSCLQASFSSKAR